MNFNDEILDVLANNMMDGNDPFLPFNFGGDEIEMLDLLDLLDDRSFSPSVTNRITIQDRQRRTQDVLCGREFTGTDHPSNVGYLQRIDQEGHRYEAFGNQHRLQTALRNRIVDEVIDNGGRFIRRTPDGWELLTLEEARRKVSQSFRDWIRTNSRN